jgi:hypothetical protein
MQSAIRAGMWLAIAGFCASVLVHVLAILGLPSPFGSGTWLLHVGIFVIWIPTVLVAQRLTKNAKQSELWKVMLRGCPAWMRIAVYGLFAYSFLNFAFFVVQGAAQSKNVPDVLEYRGFSGHWMLFYFVGATTLYSASRLGLGQQRCPNGHEVSPLASFCDRCGAVLSSSTVRKR